jgi:hypothetical protein
LQFPRRLQANPPRYKNVKLGSITIVKKLMKARAKKMLKMQAYGHATTTFFV